MSEDITKSNSVSQLASDNNEEIVAIVEQSERDAEEAVLEESKQKAIEIETVSPEEVFLENYLERCPAFSEAFDRQVEGNLSEREIAMYAQNITALGYPKVAQRFVKLNPHVTKENLFKMSKQIEKYVTENYRCYGCVKNGCAEKQIKSCHGALRTDSDGNILNSPAQLCGRDAVRRLMQYRKIVDRVEGMLDKILAKNGDKSLVRDENFIKDLAFIKYVDEEKAEEMLKQLEQGKIATTALQNKIGKVLVEYKEKAASGFDRMAYSGVLAEYANQISNLVAGTVTPEGTIWVDGSEDRYIVTNFVPLILAKYSSDMDIEKVIRYKISLLIDGNQMTEPVILEATETKNDNWLYQYFGDVVQFYSSKDYPKVRSIMLELAKEVPITVCHERTGWVKNEDGFGYCYADKCIGNDTINVGKIDNFSGYKYVESDVALPECWERVKQLLRLTPKASSKMYLMLAYTLLSLLVHKLMEFSIPPKTVLWLYGGSGVFKTEIGKIFISFFGKNDVPPASFVDTSARLEMTMYLAKDVLCLIDDYCPSVTYGGAKQKQAMAENITRNIGDRISRGRMKSSMKVVKSYPPEGNVMITAEDTFAGTASSIARHTTVCLKRGEVDVDVLTDLQNHKDMLAKFTEYYIFWLKEHVYDTCDYDILKLFEQYRSEACDSAGHRRFSECTGHLLLSMYLLTEFLLHEELITEDERTEFMDNSRQAALEWAAFQNILLLKEDVADMFMTGLQELIVSGQAQPLPVSNPDRSLVNKTFVYADNVFYYILPQSAYAEVAKFYEAQNFNFNVTDRALFEELVEKGYLEVTNNKDGHAPYKIKKKIGATEARVLKIKKSILNTF